jgi:hypothetical protein
MVVSDVGEAEQAKSTARMYEQWVFLQLVSAFRAAGLRTESADRIVRPAGWQRFSVDLERGARVSFRVPDSPLSLVIRYEPWIFPRESARDRRETIYRGRSGAAPWSPDVLIEVLAPGDHNAIAPEVLYAIVVDAKYSRTIGDSQWAEARRYLEIKSTRTDRQVVHQVWLAYPDPTGEIAPYDTDVEWNESRLTLPRGDRLLGVLPLVADEGKLVVEDEAEQIIPTDTALEFAVGVLRYLDLGGPTRSS